MLLAAIAAVTGAAGVGALGAAPVHAAAVTDEGYIRLDDGVQLHYALSVPAANGSFPTLFMYDDYSAGSAGNFDPTALNAAGYAYIGVNLRGSGCSTGILDWTDSAQWGRDGAQVVEWIARQHWSDGHVGMIGGSFDGLSQLGVAGFAPPHLDAIAPRMPTADFYRDIAYPGGIYNEGWMSEYPAFIEGNQRTALAERAGSTSGCNSPDPQSQLASAQQSSALVMPQHPFYDSFWQAAPVARLANIHIPIFGCQQWQDGAVGSRAMETYFGDPFDPRTTWFYGSNGPHGACDIYPDDLMMKFYDRYVKGLRNGFESTPHVVLAHEQYGGDQVLGQGATTAWLSSMQSWPSVPQTAALYLHAGGVLSLSTPGASEGSDAYAYPLPSSSLNVQEFGGAGLDQVTWQGSDAPGGFVSYTTPALTGDVEFFGPGSLDLWLSSTATDTDLQIMLTEVRPDGMEQYLERGWLRLSHRALDPARSTVVRPFHTDLASDAQPLVAGQPTYARVELMPFDHVFRAGSAIRLYIQAPTGTTSGDVFNYLTTPALNTVYHDATHPSELVLGIVPPGTGDGPDPSCTAIIMSEPCRKDTGTVPPGSLTVPTGPGSNVPEAPLSPLLVVVGASGAATAIVRRRRQSMRVARPGGFEPPTF